MLGIIVSQMKVDIEHEKKKSKRSSNKLSFIGEPDNDNSSVKNSVEMTDF